MPKKINMRKWFVFSLLFTLLLTISFSNVKAITEDQITNLKNTTWEFNDSIDSGWYGNIDDILFEDYDGNLFSGVEVGENEDTGIMYIWFVWDSNGTTIEVYNMDNGWLSTGFQEITFKSDVTDSNFLSFVKRNATLIDSGIVTYDIVFNNYDSSNPITSSDLVYYQINDDGIWHAIVDNNNTLPRSINDVTSIRFKNSSLTEDLVIYQSFDLFAVVLPGLTTSSYSIDSSIDFNFVLESSDVPDVPTDPDNPNNDYRISGNYRFNSTINWNYLSNYINLNFTLIDSSSNKVYSEIRLSDSLNNSNYIYYRFYYSTNLNENIAVDDIAFDLYDNNIYLVSNPTYRFLNFESQYVSEDVYNFLISNGEFGEFNEPSDDYNWLGYFLLDSLNAFLSFQLIPGFSLFNLLSLIITIPLLIYILKLFLGG